MVAPDRIYRLDDNLELDAAAPLGAASEPVLFDSQGFYRVFLSDTSGEDGPYADFFVSSGGHPVVAFHFCEGAKPEQIRAFELYAKSKDFIDRAATRWGSLEITSEIKVRSELAEPNVLWFLDECAYLDRTVERGITYEDVFSDHEFIRSAFEDAQRLGKGRSR